MSTFDHLALTTAFLRSAEFSPLHGLPPSDALLRDEFIHGVGNAGEDVDVVTFAHARAILRLF